MAEKLSPNEARVLDALFHCESPVDLTTLYEIADPRENKLTFAEMAQALNELLTAQLVSPIAGQGDVECTYSITNLGRARLVASDARKIFGERVTNNCRCAEPAADRDYEPIRATCCHRAEPELPATALICLDEDELDDWWEALDVEMKADAFTQFALRLHLGEDSHLYIEPSQAVSVPILGTVGKSAEEWKAMAERLNGKVHLQANEVNATVSPEFLREYAPQLAESLRHDILREYCSYCRCKRSIPWAERFDGGTFVRCTCAQCRPLYDADNKADDAYIGFNRARRESAALKAKLREEKIAERRAADPGSDKL